MFPLLWIPTTVYESDVSFIKIGEPHWPADVGILYLMRF